MEYKEDELKRMRQEFKDELGRAVIINEGLPLHQFLFGKIRGLSSKGVI